ncbi:MAG: hypothetical protein ABL888_07460 [Pirellulaceae bacterium]
MTNRDGRDKPAQRGRLALESSATFACSAAELNSMENRIGSSIGRTPALTAVKTTPHLRQLKE